jgi:hypothetical protein
MPRAEKVFKAAGIDVIPFPVDFLSDVNHVSILDFIPDAEALHRTSFFVREKIGRLYYTLKYWSVQGVLNQGVWYEIGFNKPMGFCVDEIDLGFVWSVSFEGRLLLPPVIAACEGRCLATQRHAYQLWHSRLGVVSTWTGCAGQGPEKTAR